MCLHLKMVRRLHRQCHRRRVGFGAVYCLQSRISWAESQIFIVSYNNFIPDVSSKFKAIRVWARRRY
jgi:hypothetical protein